MPYYTSMYPDSQLQTIFITSFHGLVSRVLACGLLEKLTADKLRVVLFVPDFKKDYFVATFGFLPNLVIEGVSRELLPRRTRFANFFRTTCHECHIHALCGWHMQTLEAIVRCELLNELANYTFPRERLGAIAMLIQQVKHTAGNYTLFSHDFFLS